MLFVAMSRASCCPMLVAPPQMQTLKLSCVKSNSNQAQSKLSSAFFAGPKPSKHWQFPMGP